MPAGVVGLIARTVGIIRFASRRLRRTAQRIQRVVDDLKEEVPGFEYGAAKTESEKLRRRVERIEASDQGASTKWYNEPVIRALAGVVDIGIWILTEYAKVGG